MLPWKWTLACNFSFLVYTYLHIFTRKYFQTYRKVVKIRILQKIPVYPLTRCILHKEFTQFAFPYSLYLFLYNNFHILLRASATSRAWIFDFNSFQRLKRTKSGAGRAVSPLEACWVKSLCICLRLGLKVHIQNLGPGIRSFSTSSQILIS